MSIHPSPRSSDLSTDSDPAPQRAPDPVRAARTPPAAALCALPALIPAVTALVLSLVLALALALPGAARAADPGKVKAFMKVTGFDSVISSLQQGAMAGPGMVGDAPKDFGSQYTALAKTVFDPAKMEQRAEDILAAVMPDKLLDAGAAFYASDLGQRLVGVENAAHAADDDQVYSEGGKLVSDMVEQDPQRLQMLKDMNTVIGTDDTSERAMVEMQLRFVMAAIASGAMQMDTSEQDLRAEIEAQIKAQAPQMRMLTVVSNAWTYRQISDDDLAAYMDELKTPEMRQVYQLLNATQYQVMIERYQELGSRLSELKPQQDL